MLKENPLSLFKVDSYKPLGIRLSFEDPTTPRERGGGGENRSASNFRKNISQVCNFLNSFVQDCSNLDVWLDSSNLQENQ